MATTQRIKAASSIKTRRLLIQPVDSDSSYSTGFGVFLGLDALGFVLAVEGLFFAVLVLFFFGATGASTAESFGDLHSFM